MDPPDLAHPRSLLPPLTGAAVALLIVAPLWALGRWPETHEGTRYLHLTLHYFEAWQAGVVLPRWLPDLAGGYGYPTFVFYQPLVFMVFSSLLALVGDVVLAAQLGVLAFVVAGGVGAGLLTGRLCPARLAMVFTALYLMTPYLFVNLWVRGDLSELAAMMVLPWLAWTSWRHHEEVQAGRSGHRFTAWTGLCLALLVLAHPIVAMLAWLTFVPARAWAARWVSRDEQERRHHRAHLALSVLIGAGLSVAYWGPVLQMRDLVQLHLAFAADYDPAQHTVALTHLFDRSWGFGTSIQDDGDRMSVQLGLAQVLAAAAGLWANRRAPATRSLGALILLWIVAMSAAGTLLWAVPPLRFAQFPWRGLTILSVLLLLAACGWRSAPRSPRLLWGLPLLLLLLSFAWQPRMFQLPPTTIGMEDARGPTLARVQAERALALKIPLVYASEDEFLPLTVTRVPMVGRGGVPLVHVVGPGEVELADDHSAHRMHAWVAADASTTLQIEQFWFPGFEVTVGGQTLEPEVLSSGLLDNGTLRFHLDPAAAERLGDRYRWEIKAGYAGPPGGGWRGAWTLASLLAFGWLLRRRS